MILSILLFQAPSMHQQRIDTIRDGSQGDPETSNSVSPGETTCFLRMEAIRYLSLIH